MNQVVKLPTSDLSIIYGLPGTGKTTWARTCHQVNRSILHADVRCGYYGSTVGEMAPKMGFFEGLEDSIEVVIFDGARAGYVSSAIENLNVKGLKIIFLCQDCPDQEDVDFFPIEDFFSSSGVVYQ